jgi:hypothetical protein
VAYRLSKLKTESYNKYRIFPKRIKPTRAIPSINISSCSTVYTIKKQSSEVIAQTRRSTGLLMPPPY